MQNGKDNKNRPLTIPKKEFNKNWDLAFKTSKEKKDGSKT